MNPLLETFWMDSKVHADASPAQSTMILGAGQRYRIVIDGNWTAWGNDSDLDHGDATVPLKHPTSGMPQTKAAFDYEVQWASADAGTYPKHGGSVFVRNGPSDTFGHREATVGPTTTYAADHIYTFHIIGANAKLEAGVADPKISDNSGRLQISIYRAPLPRVGAIGMG